MKKRIFAMGLALTLTLSLTPAMAAGGADRFPAKNTYSGFGDVAENHWAAAPIQVCFETGLMNGKSEGFDPGGTVTRAEAMVVAARIGAVLRGESIPASTDGTWYGGEVAYLTSLPRGDTLIVGDDLSQRTVPRYGLCLYLAIAVPEGALTVKNAITSLPDEDSADVLRLYNAGILTGVNDYGTFVGGKTLSRAEMAAMVARIARPETAIAFTPKTQDAPDFDVAAYYTGVAGSTLAITGKDYSITLLDYLPHYVDTVNELVAFADDQGVIFGWDLTLPDGTTVIYYAMGTASISLLRDLWEAEHGDDKHDTEDIWAVKHILVGTEAEADAIRAQLYAEGDSEAVFDALMEQLGDAALEAAAYAFGPGEMVAEFENAAKALKIGEISQPVLSQFGWHIILRTEPSPAQLADMAYNRWFEAQDFKFADAFLSIDLPAFYDNYTGDLAE